MSGLPDIPFTIGSVHVLKKTIRRLDLHPGMNILDAGCGPGRLTLPLAQKLDRMVKSPRSVSRKGCCTKHRNGSKISLHQYLFPPGEGMLGRNYFDRDVPVTVPAEIPDREAALQEIFRALKPVGILLVERTTRNPHFLVPRCGRPPGRSHLCLLKRNFLGIIFPAP